MTLTACGGNDNTQASDTSADTTVTTPVESTPDETEDSEASWIVSEADTNVSLPEGEAVKPDDGQPAEDDSAFGVDPDDNAETTVPETFENTTNSLKPIIEKITSESEWPALDMVTDPTILSEYFLLDASNENYKELMNELSTTENMILQYRTAYNNEVRAYKKYVRKFPHKQILGVMGYEVINYDYLEYSEEDRQPVSNLFGE